MKKIISGYIEKGDLIEFWDILRDAPIYPTKKGCLRALSGYENLQAKKIKIIVEIKP